MHTHEKNNTSFVPPVTKSESAGLQTRPFQVGTPQSATATGASPETTEPDIQAKIEHADSFGHDLTQAYQQNSEISVQRQVELTEEREDEEEAPIQAKLTIGQPGDKYEQEADVIAAKVMAMPDAAVGLGDKARGEGLQRELMLEDEDKEKETLQAKPQIQARGVAPAVPAGFENQLARHQGGGQPLSDETRAFMEPRFGKDFSDVRIHETPDLANAVQAQAFTHGQDIYFNSGKYRPKSSRGKELLAHELTHVIQQSGNQIQCKFDNTTYWEWYRNNKGAYDWRRIYLKKKGYKIRRLVKTDLDSWEKTNPQNTTRTKDVCWSIQLLNGDWDGANAENIVKKLSYLVSQHKAETISTTTESENKKNKPDGKKLNSVEAINQEYYRRRELLQKSFGIWDNFEVFQAHVSSEADTLAGLLPGMEGYDTWQNMQQNEGFAEKLCGTVIEELVGKIDEKIIGSTLGNAITIVQGIGYAYDYLRWQKDFEYRKNQIFFYLLWQVAYQFSNENKYQANLIYRRFIQQSIQYDRWEDSEEYTQLRNWYDKTLKDNVSFEEYQSQTRPSIWAR